MFISKGISHTSNNGGFPFLLKETRFIWTKFDNFLCSSVVWRWSSNPWVAHSNFATVLLFISFVGFINAFWDKIWKFLNRDCNHILESFHRCKYCKLSHITLKFRYFLQNDFIDKNTTRNWIHLIKQAFKNIFVMMLD